MNILLSVVIPVFNEEENIRPLLTELVPVLDAITPAYEVILVDDGSRDGTHAAILAMMAQVPRLRCLKLAKNTGQTAGFDAGFRAARGRFIATMDGDLQIDPRDLVAMWNRINQGDVDFIYGRRAKRQDSFLKRVSTKVANGVRNWLTKEQIPDTGCPLKLLRREILDRIPLYTGFHRFFITLAHIEGFRTAELPVNHRPRVAGSSKYGMWNRVFRALRDCLVVRWMQARQIRYAVDEFTAEGGRLASSSRGFRESPALERPLRDASAGPQLPGGLRQRTGEFQVGSGS